MRDAFVQEHFIAKSQKPQGIQVMTIHKSKGKEFDEVIIYEGFHQHRIVHNPDEEKSVAQARLALRVAVSRAKYKVAVLTPQQQRCPLF